ncbi:uncharacterized protein K460DRAFT_391877 [Cucurbitaria berberidis CBS 394.84]|uniref:Zn(2)-C6 fungal-type domain-containing protein n=1 Tax=Cucurbitaria berberidis CBS 394.84 TaxID=1168544 RepID=A0A9P4GUQ9_9PLEO|nr:uncharacterized protein K460DRAFT_391877 [Cucurbitaria berberidis CBS 394.84]KAF1851634.1 hypothetical protein K460DRAFT_391877 [Cucurbitaria berberidis CBS 394.84]
MSVLTTTAAVTTTTTTTTGPSTRTKQTFACEPCRKRKAKCSGTAPCFMCQRNGQACEFSYTRQRRGRKQARSLDNDSSIAPQREPGQPPSSVSPPLASNPPLSPVTPSWPPHLQDLLHSDLASQATVHHHDHDAAALAALIPPLLDIFFSAVAPQHPLFIRASDFRILVVEHRCPAYLCYALATAAIPWSSHRYLQDHQVRERTEGLFVTLVRAALDSAASLDAILSVLQSYCAIIIHTTSHGSAVQAWSDLGAAASLVRLLVLQQQLPQQRQEEVRRLHSSTRLVSDFLSICEVSLALGHPGLSISRHPSHYHESPETMLSLRHMCSLLAQVQSEARLGFSDHPLLPWLSKSPFMALHQSLDRVRLAWPETLSFELEESSATQDWLAIVLWHASIILLNNVFLPVPTARPVIDTSMDGASHHSCNLLSYPHAPAQFLEERRTACEVSAAQIASICMHIMSRGVTLLAPMLGYSCYQAAFVFLNQLHRSRPSVSPQVARHLKAVLTMLGAMRHFFHPAQAWIKAIKTVHTFPPLPTNQSQDYAEIFIGFSARFPGFEMPPFISFTDTDACDSEQRERNERELDQIPRQTGHTAEETSEPEWLAKYANQLNNDLTLDHLADRVEPIEDPAASYETMIAAWSQPLQEDEHVIADSDMPFADDEVLQALLGNFSTDTQLSEAFRGNRLNSSPSVHT